MECKEAADVCPPQLKKPLETALNADFNLAWEDKL